MSAEKLIKDFGAQDVGAWLVVHAQGTHTRVAQWNNANGVWDVLPAGHALVNPPVEEEVVEKKPRTAKAAPKGLVNDAAGLDLG